MEIVLTITLPDNSTKYDISNCLRNLGKQFGEVVVAQGVPAVDEAYAETFYAVGVSASVTRTE